MERVRGGDRQAFESLYERHYGGIVRYALGFTGNRARAEELGQEVFLQVYRARERWEPRARVTTWLYRIAHNLCLNERRRFEYRGRIDSLEGEDGVRLDPVDRHALGGEDVAAGRELAERIEELLAELPEQQRCALLLSRVEHLRYAEIGEVLGCSEQAVKSLIFRATRHLKEGLKGWIQIER